MEYLAIDWGTTNRRIYRMRTDGSVLETCRDENGVLAIAPGGYPAELAAIRRHMGDLPVICAGMVGSDRGWVEVPYLPTPCGLGDLAAGLHWIEPGRTAIVPGVKWLGSDRVDVMRGEEVQLLGAVATGLVPADALLCQPGTHCKWAQMQAGTIAQLTTAMTGEMFALLQRHSLIGSLIGGPVQCGEAFALGVRHAREGDVLSRLFSVRADHVSHSNLLGDPASYVSGLLIGTDVAPRARAGGKVHVLADQALGNLYLAACAELGLDAVLTDSHASFAAGINAIWNRK